MTAVWPFGTATLVAGDWETRCSACGGNADPGERFHGHGGRGGAYQPGSSLDDRNGCLALFTNFSGGERR